MESVDIVNILGDKMICLDLKAETKDDVIRKLAQLMYDDQKISNIDRFVRDVYLREAEGITGMGNNIAIPHGKSDEVSEACVAIGRTNNMIEWESYDEQPVNLIFLFAVPGDKKGANIHLKMLSQLATKLANEEVLEKLKKATAVEEFKKYLL